MHSLRASLLRLSVDLRPFCRRVGRAAEVREKITSTLNKLAATRGKEDTQKQTLLK